MAGARRIPLARFAAGAGQLAHGCIRGSGAGRSPGVWEIDQSAESDLHFLTRLAADHDALASVKGGNLILAPRGQAQSVSGEALPGRVLQRQDVSSWRMTLAGVWESVFKELSADPDFECVLVEATICKAHADAAGAKGGLKLAPSGVPKAA